jgi:hypothetical protein
MWESEYNINIVRRKPVNAVDQSQCNLANALFRHRPYIFWWLTEFREWLLTGVRTKNGPFAHSYGLSAQQFGTGDPGRNRTFILTIKRSVCVNIKVISLFTVA